MALRRCPCGTGLAYDDCCGPRHDGTSPAATAEQLMRSRYSAFVLRNAGYLLATWHPDTRPATLELAGDLRWTGLDILGTRSGGPFDTEGTVEFRAHYRSPRGAGAQHENSCFVREGGRWRYLDGRRAGTLPE